MLRLFLREIVRLPRLHNKKSKVAIFKVITRLQPCALPPTLLSIIHQDWHNSPPKLEVCICNYIK